MLFREIFLIYCEDHTKHMNTFSGVNAELCLLKQVAPITGARGLRHELSSLALTLGSWVRIPLEAWMSVCVYYVFVLSRV
jgi:hypothetical protein